MTKWNRFDTNCKNERAIFTRSISFTGPSAQSFKNFVADAIVFAIGFGIIFLISWLIEIAYLSFSDDIEHYIVVVLRHHFHNECFAPSLPPCLYGKPFISLLNRRTSKEEGLK